MVKTLSDRFWSIIDATVDDDEDRQIEALTEVLEKLSIEQLVAYDRDFHAASSAAYRWDLWGAAYIINGGCSDDGFMDFRSWLIAQGRAVYEAALASPESLADHIQSDYAMFEEFAYVHLEIYEEKTGDLFPSDDLSHPSEPVGVKWQEEKLDDMFPLLTKKVKSFE
ncbi:DUF4240 domain-containing protein [Alphaproteobacteria bacterium GH1-50]|uniref:DUF4240 domain-containing protein n=1 Tax=Kangsaoukella pontilimi TaxID=2691042 RepID=A0A7C9IML5_9RHOB|nr:DUF4240 domain-containing protein [Kangsaoukella pontilimi]MXQ06750.1 DUF4240 domain-containing protein [Kangsaoukella pontilimi]